MMAGGDDNDALGFRWVPPQFPSLWDTLSPGPSEPEVLSRIIVDQQGRIEAFERAARDFFDPKKTGQEQAAAYFALRDLITEG